MKTIYFKIVNIVIFTMLTAISFGQVKQITTPNITNHFLTNKVKRQGVIVKPQKTNESVKQNENFIFQSEKDVITIRFNENNETKASDFFQEFSKKMDIKNDDTFTLMKSEVDEIGFTHYRFQQNYKNIPLDGVQLMLHEKNGKLVSANGNFYSSLALNTIPSISIQDAIQKAIEFVGAEKYLWNNNEEEDFFKKEKNDVNATYYPKAVLVIAPVGGVYSKENFKLCYKINIFSELPYDNVDVYVDAQTGKLVNQIGKIAHADVIGTANTLYSDIKTITMDNNAGTYTLKESTRPIQTLNMKNGTNYSNAVDFTNTSNNWNSQEVVLESVTITAVNNNWEDILGEKISNGGAPDIYIEIRDANNTLIWKKVNNINDNNVSSYYENTFLPITINTGKLVLLNGPYTLKIFDDDVTSLDDLLGTFSFTAVSGTGTFSSDGTSGSISRISRNNPGLDVHWAMEKTYDYYLTKHSRNSYDNNGSLIKNYVHRGIAYNNAGWNRYLNLMYYGDGDGQTFTPLTSIDVVGHEFSHAVIQYTADLYYQNESGALNESFADIFGTAIEFYGSSSPNWTMGESIVIQTPNYLRSMSNPKIEGDCAICGHQPNTYNGQYWAPLIQSSYPTQPPTSTNDNGGVHINSGVQNYWFYLLSQGGSGTIDDAGTTPYSVTGIGITKATKIAYRNLSYYLSPTSNYLAAAYGSLQAAEDLYPTVGGVLSQEYNSVKQAWYAVGVVSSPSSTCSGTTNLSAISGTFSDGSGNANYIENSNCSWLIAPAGATQVSINFTSFNTELTNDVVTIYDGPNASYPVLATLWGNTLPPTITTSVGTGAMFVKFTTNSTLNYSGWTANYLSVVTSPTCSGLTMLTTSTGTFSDGSGINNYTNNQECYWYIAPPCATSVTLSLSQLDIENTWDKIYIFDSLSATTPLISFTGTTLPASVTSNTGIMLVVFVSDFSTTSQGFTANYTSTGSSFCSGLTTINTSDYGSISDGSGANTYCNNSNCSWLIQPPQATTVTLNFTAFELESASVDGNSIYDVVEVYDGTSSSSTLLGKFTGNNIPAAITSSGGSMYIKFTSDISGTYQGWSAYYTSTQNSNCNSSTSTLTSSSGTFTDGSGVDKYANNSECTWLIQPANATSITLSFSSFDTELNYDGVIVYDGANNTVPVLGQFTGSTLPPSVTSSGGSMYVIFLSDEALRKNGWTANYNSTTLGINDFETNEAVTLYPNPTNSKIFFDNTNDGFKEVTIYNYLGQNVAKTSFTTITNNQEIDMSNLATGVYVLKFTDGDKSKSVKVIKQ